MYIKETLNINQQPAKYYRLGTYGDRLWDEKGFLDVTGVSQLSDVIKIEGYNPDTFTTKSGGLSMPLPTDSKGNIVDFNGNLILDVSGNPVKSKDFVDNSSNVVTTSVVSETKSENKPNVDVKSNDDDGKIFGMTKQQLLVGIGLGILVGFVAYYGYKKMKTQNIKMV